MKMKTLGSTGLRVSEIALGTMHFATGKVPEEMARMEMDAFIDRGGNFIDTARVYGASWSGSANLPLSEMAVGRWLWERKNRDKVVISTKGAHPILTDKSRMRLHPDEIRSDLDKSLEHLRTTYIDIYFLHRDDVSVPVPDILETLDDERRKGKIRFYGCSNWTLGRMKEAWDYAKGHALEGFSVNQAWVCLPDINKDKISDKTLVPMDSKMYQWHSVTKMPVMAYSSIARGYLMRLRSGKALSAHHTASYENNSSRAIAGKLEETGTDPLVASLQSLTHVRQFTIVPVVSFTDMMQLEAGLDALEEPYPEGLDEVWAMKNFLL